ncbi:MAG TPA: hypothetical protein V6C81_21610 [Planktothrix sp.]|jgi:hypothetical protein
MNEESKATEQLLFFQDGGRRSVDFALTFADAEPLVPKIACRLTGGCGNMTTADAIGMRNLEQALCGFTKGGGPRRHFAGFGIFGGTRMISPIDPTIVIPGITEIFPNVVKHCPGADTLGIVAGFRRFSRSQEPGLTDKLILSRENNLLTIVHPDPRAVLLLQPTPDNDSVWDDEYKETQKCFTALHDLDWKTLNIVYNGGSVTEREIKLWAYLGRRQPGLWNMLLIKDSGRKASEYASNAEFLAQHPNIHVAENDVNAINDKLWQLGVLVEKAQSKVIPFRKRA